MKNRRKKDAFTFIEVLVAILTVGIFLTYLVWFTSNTSTDTAKTTNYLRALILAQEAIELIQSIPARNLKSEGLSLIEGSLVDPGSLKSVKMPVEKMTNSNETQISYPDSYSPAYFYREIILGDVVNGSGKDSFLRDVVVNVYWNEGKAAQQINSPKRMKKLSMAALVLDEKKFY